MSAQDKLTSVLAPPVTWVTSTFTTVGVGAWVKIQPGNFDISIRNLQATTAWGATVYLERGFESGSTVIARRWGAAYSTVVEAVKTAGSWCQVRFNCTAGALGLNAEWCIRQGS
ncbi:hypothetical protein KKG46_06155 [Patescibacteria group bacterium]|nr:hypothetical protein [Patescibacteria group bacterium]